MSLLRLTLAAAAILAVVGVLTMDSLHAGDKDKDKKGDDAKKVELRGTIQTGVVAIGGETTGTTIKTKKGTYELAVPKALRVTVDKLNKKTAVVTGTLTVRKGVEVKERRIVNVETVKGAD